MGRISYPTSHVDENGEEWNTYLFTYPFEGDNYSFLLPARSSDDALERVKKLPWATYEGTVTGEYNPVAFPFVRLWWAIKRYFR